MGNILCMIVCRMCGEILRGTPPHRRKLGDDFLEKESFYAKYKEDHPPAEGEEYDETACGAEWDGAEVEAVRRDGAEVAAPLPGEAEWVLRCRPAFSKWKVRAGPEPSAAVLRHALHGDVVRGARRGEWIEIAPGCGGGWTMAAMHGVGWAAPEATEDSAAQLPGGAEGEVAAWLRTGGSEDARELAHHAAALQRGGYIRWEHVAGASVEELTSDPAGLPPPMARQLLRNAHRAIAEAGPGPAAEAAGDGAPRGAA